MKTRKILAMAATLLAFGSPGYATDILYGSYVAPDNGNNKYGLQRFFDEANRLSNGSLNFELIPGGALVGATTTLDGIRDGIVDGGIVISFYHSSELPYNSMLTNLTAYGGEPASAAAAINETTLLDCPKCMEEWESLNIKHLGAYATGSYKLLCSKEVNSLEDIKGWQVRASGALARLVTFLGATPIALSGAEMYEALQRGQTDCNAGPISFLKGFSLGDVAKYVYDIPGGGYFGGTIANLNLDKWNSLTEEERSALIAAAPKAISGASILGYINEEKDYLENELEENGITITQATDAELALIDEFKKSERQYVIDTAKEAGVEGAEEIVDAFLKNLEKWEGIIAEIGTDTDKYEEALHREIYSKLTP